MPVFAVDIRSVHHACMPVQKPQPGIFIMIERKPVLNLRRRTGIPIGVRCSGSRICGVCKINELAGLPVVVSARHFESPAQLLMMIIIKSKRMGRHPVKPFILNPASIAGKCRIFPEHRRTAPVSGKPCEIRKI